MPSGIVANAQYFRARLLMKTGQQGAALNALVDAAEADDNPPLLMMVDDVFAPIRDERRYENIVRFCDLAARRMPELNRPWKKDE